LDTGRVEAVGAGFGIGDEAVECSAQWIGIADQPGFASAGEHYASSGGVDRGTRGVNPFDSQILFVKRRIGAAGIVFDRQSGHARVDAKLHVFRYTFGFISVAV
jgi:hypothetical protein